MRAWALLLGGVAMLGIILVAFHAGEKYERAGHLDADLKQSNLVRVQQEVIIRKVPKLVAHVITVNTTTEREVERVVTKIPDLLDADCLMPARYGQLLVAAANGVDPATPGGLDPYAGAYGCREVLKATLADLKAGWKNSASLAALEQWAELVTTKEKHP